jgi:hypothetical protein
MVFHTNAALDKQTQAGGFIHNLFIIARLKGALVREEQATSELVSPLPPVGVQLHPRPERFILDIAQEVEALEGLP